MNDAVALCGVFKRCWEANGRYSGEFYAITQRDRGSAKQLMQLNPDLTLGEVAVRAHRYLGAEFWAVRMHPAYGLFEHFSEYAVARKPHAAEADKRGPMIYCSTCETNHHAYEKCKAHLPTGEVL